MATLVITGSCSGAVPVPVISTFLSRYVNDFYIYLSRLIFLLLPLPLLVIVSIRAIDAGTLFYLIVISNVMSGALFHVLSRSMLAKFVPENVQTVTEATRNSLFELAYLFGGCCSKWRYYIYLNQWFYLVCYCYLVWFGKFANVKFIWTSRLYKLRESKIKRYGDHKK